MTIIINSTEYQCWHEVGHATACLHFGGDVAFIEILDDENAEGLARARCSTTPDIRPSVACGGFAIEFFLLRKGLLGRVDEQEITQIIFRNATKDREMFVGRAIGDDEIFPKELDEKFMHHATSVVAPIFNQYFWGMQKIVDELVHQKKIEGKKVKELLLHC